MKFEVKIEVVLIVILLTSAVRELDCREQADNFFDTKGNTDSIIINMYIEKYASRKEV